MSTRLFRTGYRHLADMQQDYRDADRHIAMALDRPNLWRFKLWHWYEPPDDDTEFHIHTFEIPLLDGEYI